MLMSISLKYKMILGGVAAVFIPFLIAGVIIYIQLSSSLMEITEERAVHIAADTSELIHVILTKEIELATSIAVDPVMVEASKSADYRLAQTKLEAICERIGKSLYNLFLADKMGTIRADSRFKEQKGLNLSDRDYFQRAKQGKTSIFGPYWPRGDATPDMPIFMVSVPIQDEKGFLGIIGMPFETNFTAKAISEKKAGKTGFSFVINQKGLILTHPQKEYTLKRNLFEQPGTSDFQNAIRSNPNGTASYNLNGMEMIAGYSKDELTGWIAVFAQSRDEILLPVNNVLSYMFISAIIFLIITTLTIVVLSSRISSPIQKMLSMMKQITKHSSEMILQIGPDHKIMFANPACEKIIGIKTDDLVGTEPDLTTSNNVSISHIWESLEKGNPWSGRITLENYSSEPVHLDVMMVPLKDERDNIQSYLAIGRDVSAEIMYEKRLQEAQKLEAIGTLAGGIAHDFNNILTSIFGFAELFLMPGGTDEENEKHIRQIIVAAERARGLVNQILTFSRKTTVELRPLSPKLVLKETLKLLRATIPATIDIISSINSDAAIMAEPTQIHQVVMNLFTNAKHAIGEKVGTITLELEDFMVDEEFTKTHPEIKQGKHILIRVSDTGRGIAPEIMDHIFEPFYTTKSQGEGTGLGLSVVHGIVKKIGGIITVYSKPGEGTAFNVILPCTQEDWQALEKDEYHYKRGNARIVIVDDETSIAASMQMILTKLGYKVTSFTNSTEALQAIEANPDDFDVLITDFSMPQRTGLEVAMHLREVNIDLPIILISGYFSHHIEQTAREHGIAMLIPKPINTYQLTDAVHKLVNEKQA